MKKLLRLCIRLAIYILIAAGYLLAAEAGTRILFGSILKDHKTPMSILYKRLVVDPSPFFRIKSRDGLNTYYETNSDNLLYDSVQMQKFTMPKKKGTFRIFCVGESSVEGYPYRGDPEKSFPGRMQEYFKRQYPGAQIEVINAGKGATCSLQLVERVREITDYDPDCVLVYAGHNEYGYYYWQKELLRLHPLVLRFDAFLSKSYVYRLLLRIFNHGGIPPQNETNTWKKYELPRIIRQKYEGYIPSKQWELFAKNELILREQVFEGNLSKMRALLEPRGINFTVCTVVSNIKDYYPFVSFHCAGLRSLDQWKKTRTEALGLLENKKYPDALKSLSAMARLDPSYAETYFLLGNAYYGLNRFDKARENFIMAKDKSPAYAPFQRAPSSLNDTIRKFCGRNGITLIDIEKEFYAYPANNGIPGNDLFHDNLHPNEQGYRLIAEIIVRHMKEMTSDRRR